MVAIISATMVIRGIKAADGKFMGLIQIGWGVFFVIGGISSVKDYTIAAVVGLVIFAGIVSGYFYFIPTLLNKKKIVAASKMLNKNSNFATIFGRHLDSVEERIVSKWIDTFGDTFVYEKKIFIAPNIDEELLSNADDKIGALSRDESAIVYFADDGILITTKGVHWLYFPSGVYPKKCQKKEVRYKDIDIEQSKLVNEKGIIFESKRLVLAPAGDLDSHINVHLGSFERTEELLEMHLSFFKVAARIAQNSKT